jgi:hypothetical protein
MATINVELMAFGEGQIRPVEIPEGTAVTLDTVYVFGQNNMSNNHLRMPSVSMGDIIHLDEKKWLVKDIGFRELSIEEYAMLTGCMKLAIASVTRYSDVLWEHIGEGAMEYA